MLFIKVATSTDHPVIQQIAHQTWPDTFGSILSETQIAYMLNMMYSLEALQSQVGEQGHVFLLVLQNDTPLGYVSYELNYKNKPHTKIHKIYLLPAAQGKGAGKALIKAVAQAAVVHQNTALTLNVNRQNPAIDFYKRLGFEIVGQENIDIGNGFLMEDFVMFVTTVACID